MRSHISYKGETILKMNEKGDKAKSLAASGSSQNIAKTLKMFRDMDAKEQAPPVPQAKLKPGLTPVWKQSLSFTVPPVPPSGAPRIWQT